MFILILVLFLLSPVPSLAQSTPYGQTGNWSQVFADEFNGNSIDLTKWKNGYHLWTNDNNMGNADISNSTSDGQYLHLGTSGNINNFTVGAISTKQTFNSGYFEARMKLPKGIGAWPAFWALYDSNGTYREVDFMEYLGNHTNYYYSTLHINGNSPQGVLNVGTTDLSTDFHVYAGEITPTSIVFYFDGVEFWRSAQTDFNYPFGLIVNQGIMCNGVIWDDNKCDSTTFSPTKETLVDWVRVWNRDATIPTPTPSPTVALSPIPTITTVPTPTQSITPTPTAILSPTPTLAHPRMVCDINNDGGVNLLDFVIWRDEYLKKTNTATSDCNHDSLVNLADFALWKINRR